MLKIRKANKNEVEAVLVMALKLDDTSTKEKIEKSFKDNLLYIAVIDQNLAGYLLA